MPFHHPDRAHGLGTRIEMEVRERLEEAVDYVCLEALVRTRRERGLPPPAADSDADRREYTAHVRAFLMLLERELTAALDVAIRRKLPVAESGGDESARLMSVQVALARLLPDYWQRFDEARSRYLAEPPPSGSETGGSLLSRLFRRG
jgi:hypothetical protein